MWNELVPDADIARISEAVTAEFPDVFRSTTFCEASVRGGGDGGGWFGGDGGGWSGGDGGGWSGGGDGGGGGGDGGGGGGA